MGRRPQLDTLDPKVRKIFLSIVAEGVWLQTACDIVGLKRSSVDRWISTGEKDDAEEPYASFAADVAEARGKCKHKWTKDLRDRFITSETVKPEVQLNALKFYLSKLFPEEFGDKQRLEHTGAEGAPLASGVVFLPTKDEPPEVA